MNGFVATDLWRFVRNIKAPILYIIGGRSNIVPAETQDELRKTLPNAQLITVPTSVTIRATSSLRRSSES